MWHSQRKFCQAPLHKNCSAGRSVHERYHRMGRNSSISAERGERIILLAKEYLFSAFKNYICCRCFHTRGHFCFLIKAQNRFNLFHLNHNGTLDEKYILKSRFVHQWPNLVLSKHSHAMRVHIQHTQFTHTKKDSWGLDFRRQSHFYSKVSLSSTCNDTFKWNTTCSDSALRKQYDHCTYLGCSESSPVVPVRYSKLSVVVGPVANYSDTHNANQTLSLAFRVTSVRMDQSERALGSRLALSWQIMRDRGVCRSDAVVWLF